VPGDGHVFVIVNLFTLAEGPRRLGKRPARLAAPYVHIQREMHSVIVGVRIFLIEFRDRMKAVDEVPATLLLSIQ
jgi:hypothetical protein